MQIEKFEHVIEHMQNNQMKIIAVDPGIDHDTEIYINPDLTPDELNEALLWIINTCLQLMQPAEEGRGGLQ